MPPFPTDYRASGILLHVTSLPSPYGIGDVGPSAIAWIDRLHQAGQTYWQALPLGPTGYGDSPYQALSSFAGNALLISPEWLIEDGFVRASDFAGCSFSPTTVDFDAIKRFKYSLLQTAWRNFSAGAREDLQPAVGEFGQTQAHWLDDYALFRALKERYRGAPYLEWPAEIVGRAPAALDRARRDLSKEVDQVRFSQFLLFRQGARLKVHARARGVRLIGDLPFFVSPDSSDVWANPELFLLDDQHKPRVVAGVPPDYFSAHGQRWGNPIYDWDELAAHDYRFCIDRVHALLAHVDAIRLDHFRGFAAAWHVPFAAPTAQTGEWKPGPGARFFTALQKELGGLPFFAEDLGIITPDVSALRDEFHLPGTRVLQFAFDGHSDNPHLPDNYVANTVGYTGTHDNPTTRGWYEDLPDTARGNLWRYLKRPGGTSTDASPALLGVLWSSVAALALAPLQDVLNLGKEARMNQPGTAEGNWRWRSTDELLAVPAFESLQELTRASARAADAQGTPTASSMAAAP
ncbi:MAG: 4-alpha-glucanotransferase [Myxococcales bacterium]